MNFDVKEYNFDPDYNCWKCQYLLDEIANEMFKDLPDIETSLSKKY